MPPFEIDDDPTPLNPAKVELDVLRGQIMGLLHLWRREAGRGLLNSDMRRFIRNRADDLEAFVADSRKRVK